MKAFCKITLLLLISLTSCKQATEKQFNIDIDAPQGYQDLNFSDILEDFKFVALETGDEFLVSPESNTCVSSKYIIASNNNDIHLFDIEGKYLRKLIAKGNGPEEFNTIMSLLIDDNRDILYYTDMSDYDDNSKIRRVNLKTGKHLDPILTQNNALNYIDSKGNIWGVGHSRVLVRLGEDSRDNQSKDSLPTILATKWSPESEEFQKYHGTRYVNITNSMNISLVGYKDDVSLINLIYSDTLFNIGKKNLLTPLYSVKISDLDNDIMQSSVGLRLLFQYKGGIVLTKNKREVNVTRSGGNINSISIRSLPSEYLHIDGNGVLKRLRNMYIDPLDYKVDIELYSKSRSDETIEKPLFSPFVNLFGNYGFIRFDSYKILDYYQELKNQGADKKILDAIEQVCDKVEEDGNPVYLIGRIK